MKNIELFKMMLNDCNKMMDLKNQLNKIEIPENIRDISKAKVHQILDSKGAEIELQNDVKTLLSSLSLKTKCIDEEYLKHLKDNHNTIMHTLSRIIEYNPNEGIANDYFAFAECVPSVKRFLESEIYKYEYLSKEAVP